MIKLFNYIFITSKVVFHAICIQMYMFPVFQFLLVMSSITPGNDELQRYNKQRQWIRDCRTVPFPIWLLKELSLASSDEDKKAIYIILFFYFLVFTHPIRLSSQ